MLKKEETYIIFMKTQNEEYFQDLNIENKIKGKCLEISENDFTLLFQDHDTKGRFPQAASYALVFMVVGARKQVKQPVAYYLSNDRLSAFVKEVCVSSSFWIMIIDPIPGQSMMPIDSDFALIERKRIKTDKKNSSDLH